MDNFIFHESLSLSVRSSKLPSSGILPLADRPNSVMVIKYSDISDELQFRNGRISASTVHDNGCDDN